MPYKESKKLCKKLPDRVPRKKLQYISSHDLQKLHKKLKATPYQAKRVRLLLSKMFTLAIEWGGSENPALFIKQYQEAKRTRWLNDGEMRHL